MMSMPRTALLAAALLAVPCQAQTNFLTNPGFESGFSGWGMFGNVASQTANPPQFTPRTGNGLASLAGQGGAFNVSGIFQSFPASPGDQFTLDAYSRHWAGDPLIGAGPPNDNWAIMKMAFFDVSNNEIGGVEATILDGNSPVDVWIDNPAIMGTAPAGTVTVQAFVMFLQPAAELGTALVDDLFFTGPARNAPYPGTNEDLLLTTGVGPGPTTGGTGNYIKTANAGDLLTCNVLSPGNTYDMAPYFLLGQGFATGNPPQPSIFFPALHFDIRLPVLVLVNGGLGGPLGPPRIGPLQGTSTYYTAPAGFGGSSIMLQAVVIDPNAANGIFAASDGYEIQFN